MTDQETLLEASRFRVVRLQYETSRGVHTREVVRHPGAVTIIPMVDDDRVCLIRQWRAAVAETLIELPAGTLEPDEPPSVTAGRELIEETGYRAERIDPLHDFYLSPGILDEKMHLFVARDLTEGETAREPGEEIENLIVPWNEAMGLIERGEIRDAKTIVGLLHYDRVRRATS